MTRVRWRFDDGSAGAGQDHPDVRWARPDDPGHGPRSGEVGAEERQHPPNVSPANQGEPVRTNGPGRHRHLRRRRFALAVAAVTAGATILVAARVAGNARLLARVEGEVSRAVSLERQALGAGDQAVWSTLQWNADYPKARRRYRAGVVGPAPSLRPVETSLRSIDVDADVAGARAAGGQIDRAEVRVVGPVEAISPGGAVPAGLFAESASWRRAEDGTWLRLAQRPEELARWPDTMPSPEQLVPLIEAGGEAATDMSRAAAEEVAAAIVGRLESLRRDVRSGGSETIPRLATKHLALQFHPADEAVAADLAARLEPVLARRCRLLDQGGCRRAEVSLTIDTPGAAFVVPGAGYRLASPAASLTPVDEEARIAYARAVLRVILRDGTRQPRAIEVALVDRLLAELGMDDAPMDFESDPKKGSDPNVADASGNMALPPDSWRMWRHLRPSVDALGGSAGVSPQQRVAAAQAEVTWEATRAWARHLADAAGYAGTERLIRDLEGGRGSSLLSWLRPVLDEAALGVALAWGGTLPDWQGAPQIVRCDLDADPILLAEPLGQPVDLRSAMCSASEIAAGTVVSPDGSIVAVACRPPRRGIAEGRIVLARIEGDGTLNVPDKLGFPARFDCCLRWRGDDELVWNAAGLSRGLRRAEWHGAVVDRDRARMGRIGVLARWEPNGWQSLHAPSEGWSPDGSSVVVRGAAEGRERIAVFDAPGIVAAASGAADDGAPETRGLLDQPFVPRWEAFGSQPQWFPDGSHLVFVVMDRSEGSLTVVRASDGAVVDALSFEEVGAEPEQPDPNSAHLPSNVMLAGTAADASIGFVVVGAGQPAPVHAWTWRPRITGGPSDTADIELESEPIQADVAVSSQVPVMAGLTRHAELAESLWAWRDGLALMEPRIKTFLTRRGGDADLWLEPTATRRFGEDGRWTELPPAAVGVRQSDRAAWVVESDGLTLREDGGEVIWSLRGPGCLPEVEEPWGSD